MMFNSIPDDICMTAKFPSNSPICHISANTLPQVPNPCIVTITTGHQFALNRWNLNYTGEITKYDSETQHDGFRQNLGYFLLI